MSDFQYAPPAPLSTVDAITITQTLAQLVGASAATITTLTTLTLSRSSSISTQQPTETSQPQSHPGLSPSAIGAVVGSILGFVLLLILVYFFCCRATDDFSEGDPDPLAPPEEVKKPSPSRIEKVDGWLVESHPRNKRRHLPPMNTARRSSRRPTYAVHIHE